MRSEGQTTPQAPQFMRSVNGSTHAFEHTICWPGQTQEPVTHEAPVAQEAKHAPQCSTLEERSGQLEPHGVVPDGHSPTHVPAAQRSPKRHVLPHAPQFRASTDKSAHVLPQSVAPEGHSHWPLTHERAPLHTMPQAPQFAGLACRSTQPPLHAVNSGAHAEVHAPCEQYSP